MGMPVTLVEFNYKAKLMVTKVTESALVPLCLTTKSLTTSKSNNKPVLTVGKWITLLLMSTQVQLLTVLPQEPPDGLLLPVIHTMVFQVNHSGLMVMTVLVTLLTVVVQTKKLV